MPYRIRLHKRATKALRNLPQHVRGAVKQRIDLLAEDPYRHPRLDINMAPLRGKRAALESGAPSGGPFLMRHARIRKLCFSDTSRRCKASMPSIVYASGNIG
uniref:Uncharacterized protein n=1 Tax=Candidatus Kentrum sp. DK TaxID=2126562 RepID=A0A450TF34_9GAMM|nr:MAG: hypothetical protein BECKDK2373C_GA0170839_11354 [Candidatus Kentron sp. DK]